jgi:AcrR family transcriptional regulator
MARPDRSSRSRTRRTRKQPLRQLVEEDRKNAYRRAINEAAERLFAEKGTDRSRMREIAAAAGISLGTLYGVIDGKDSLFRGIYKTRMDEFTRCIRDASRSKDDTLSNHIAVVRLGAQYFLDHPDFLRMCSLDGYSWSAPVPASSRGADLWNELASIPRDLFTRGIAEGIYFEDAPDLLVRKMLALKQVELTHWVEQGMQTPHDVVLDRLENQFVRAFCKRAS